MLHLGAYQLTSLTSPLHLIALTLIVLGLVRAVAGPAPSRPVSAWILVPASVLAAVGWLGTPTAVLFAPARPLPPPVVARLRFRLHGLHHRLGLDAARSRGPRRRRSDPGRRPAAQA